MKCPAIDGLITEADEVAGEVADKQVLDAAIVGAAQSVEHYEIARYGTLIAWADKLGRDDVVRLLTTNLNEEGRRQEAVDCRAAQGRQSEGGELRSRPTDPACPNEVIGEPVLMNRRPLACTCVHRSPARLAGRLAMHAGLGPLL